MLRSRRFLVPLLAALAAAVSLAALPAAGDAQLPKVPKGVKFPKVIRYPVTVDAVGYVDFRWTYDNREKCLPGYSKTIEKEFSFELGRPRRAIVQIVGGSLVMFPVHGGSAAAKSTVSGFQTSNYCPPTPKAPEPESPTCTTMRGKLGVALSSQPDAGEELKPLSTPVVVSLYRNGGGAQRAGCWQERPKLQTIGEDEGLVVEPAGDVSVPLGAHDVQFWRLRKGGKIAQTITIGGGCEGITASASSLSPFIKHCSIHGKAHVVIKRIG